MELSTTISISSTSLNFSIFLSSLFYSTSASNSLTSVGIMSCTSWTSKTCTAFGPTQSSALYRNNGTTITISYSVEINYTKNFGDSSEEFMLLTGHSCALSPNERHVKHVGPLPASGQSLDW